MKKTGIAVFSLMFIAVSYVSAQNVQVNFDGENVVQNGQSMEKFLMPEAFSDIEYDIPTPKREVKYKTETLENAEFQEIISTEVCNLAHVSVSTTDLVIIGAIDESQQICKISDDKLACTLSDNKDNFESEINGLMFARAVYLDSMLNVWMLTHDIREACPGTPQTVCTGGVKYVCNHKKVTVSEWKWVLCSDWEYTHGNTCNSNGFKKVKEERVECHVSCSATSKPC